MPFLTKSKFKLAQECTRKLFYADRPLVYANTKQDDEFLRALADGGHQVGTLARLMHMEGPYYNIETLNRDEALRQTNDHLQANEVTLFEAAVQFENCFILVDVLRKSGNMLELIEVKSKSFDPDEPNPFFGARGGISSGWRPYLEDVAFQKYVLSRAFPHCTIRSYLMLANKSATATVNGLNRLIRAHRIARRVQVMVAPELMANPALMGAPLLVKVPVDDAVEMIKADVDDAGRTFTQRIEWMADAYSGGEAIPQLISAVCAKCEFRAKAEDLAGGLTSAFRECWSEALGWGDRQFNQPHLFDLWNYRQKAQRMAEGKYLLADLQPDDIAQGVDVAIQDSPLLGVQRQWLQRTKAVVGDLDPYLDVPGLQAEMAGWQYPLHFIDFETSTAAIPFHEGMHPYETVAFQFSHHMVSENGSIAHQHQYLHFVPGEFPNFHFVRALRDALCEDEGTIFRYAAHENTVLCHIWQQLERSDEPDKLELMAFIESITRPTGQLVSNWEAGPRDMVDLLEVVKGYYYHPMMGGSNSIKKVLPAVLNSSALLQERYSQPIYGTPEYPSLNLVNKVWVAYNDEGRIIDPYTSLPSVLEGYDPAELDLYAEMLDYQLADGGAAMLAYGRLQYTDMNAVERDALYQALLRYCELDTLSMVMIWEYFREGVGL